MKIQELFEFKMPLPPDNSGGGSVLLGQIARLLDAGNKIDFVIPGIKGHVVRADPVHGAVILKRWNMPYSKINYALPLTSKSDKKFFLVPVGPKKFNVTDENPETS